MSSPAAAPPHLSEKPSSGRPLEGLAGIIAFFVVAGILVVGPRIWTIGEALGSLRRTPAGDPEALTAPVRVSRPAAVAPARRAPVASPPATQPRATSVPAKASPRPAGAAPGRKVTSKAAPAATPRPAVVPPVPASAAGEVRLQHYYAVMDEGVWLYRRGWFGPSVGRFRQATALMPSSPYAHLWLGRAGIAAQRPDEARRALQRVIVLAPDSQAASEAATLLKQLSAGNI